jgi:hypothetical protein
MAIERVQAALRDNPYAADLHTNLLKLYAEDQNKAGVEAEFKVIKRIAPHAPLIQQLERSGLK